MRLWQRLNFINSFLVYNSTILKFIELSYISADIKFIELSYISADIKCIKERKRFINDDDFSSNFLIELIKIIFLLSLGFSFKLKHFTKYAEI